MKVVIHYKNGSYLGITENWIYSQTKNLKRYRPIVYALCSENLNVYPTECIRSFGPCRKGSSERRTPLMFLNRIFNKIFSFYPMFCYYLRKDKPDLIHAHFGPSGYSFLKLKDYYHVPMITTFYGYDLSMLPLEQPKWRKRYKKLFAEGERFLVEGSHMRNCLVKLGCPEEKIRIFHLGVDLKKIKFVARDKYAENGDIKILIAASFREKKGIPFAIEAVGRVARKRSGLTLTIIGDSNGNDEGEREKKKIIELIEKYDLKSKVRMLGYQPHDIFVKELYENHIFIHPSVHASNGDTEGGSPVSIIEASASGIPILSTFHCDIPEVVIDNKSGFLVPERNVEALEERLEFMLTNCDLWKKMGLCGRRRIEDEYDMIKQAIKLEDIYDECVSMRSSLKQ
ncbi:MAG: glycosyltransferase [Candidatus Paceibacterota bacterium]|jgi:colanic acid/amylovoran biosynthesis glycosyltransferase